MVNIPVFPGEEAPSEDFVITVNGAPVQAYRARVSAMPYNTPWPGHQRPMEQTEWASFLGFETDAPVCVRITAKSDVSQAVVRPLSKGVRPQIRGREVTFVLPGAGQYTFEADGFHHALHIFADPFSATAQADEPLPTIRFGPGVHMAGEIRLHSHEHLVIEAGAVVYGSVLAVNAEDVRITGEGILDGSREKRTDEDSLLPYAYGTEVPKEEEAFLAFCRERRVLNGNVRFYNCKNVVVQGIVARDAATFSLICAKCTDVLIDGYKTIGMWRYNSDGIDLFNCRNVEIRRCFLRNFDDAIVIKGICGWDEWNNENIHVHGCTVWCDWGRALELGAETNAPEYKNILFEDCDLIHGCAVYMDIQHHNYADIHDVCFRNIRCEYNQWQQPERYQPSDDVPYTQAPTAAAQPLLIGLFIHSTGLFAAAQSYRNGRIRSILFEDIQVLTDEGMPMAVSCFAGLDDKHDIRDVRICGLTHNGCRLTERGEACLQANLYVHDLLLT